MKNNNSIDANLVKQFQSGNAKALAELIKRWHKPFCDKAYWIVKDADLSKDITQESWNTIMAKIKDLKDPNSFSSWAMRIVYTKSLDTIRQQQKERLQLKVFAKEQSIDLDIPRDDSQLKKNLLRAIKKLPNQQQMVLKLFYVEGYSLKEIGELLKISIGTVKSRLFHARETLKVILKKNRTNY